MHSTKIIASILFGLGIQSIAYADVIGVKGDLSYWNFNGSSEYQTSGRSSTQKNDLDRQGTVQASIAFEHPIPLLPNAKIKYVNLDSASPVENGIQSDIELTNTNYILYYEILDNIVSADIGVGATQLDGKVKQLTAAKTNVYNFSDFIPLVYAQAGIKLPFTGLSLKAEGTYSKLDDTTAKDFQAELQYNFIDNLLVDIGAKVGYRILDIEHQQDNLADLTLKFKGPYIGIDVHF